MQFTLKFQAYIAQKTAENFVNKMEEKHTFQSFSI